MSIPYATLMCHAPIVIPRIAGGRSRDCASTTRAMRAAATALVAHGPELVVLISPHTPRRAESWGIVRGTVLSGSFARFGQPDLQLTFPGNPDAARVIGEAAAELGLLVHPLAGSDLDHGALVPLYFVREAGYVGPIIVASLPYPGHATEVVFGRALRIAAEQGDRRWAVLASGDMSHRLTVDAPSGYHPRAAEFDRRFVELLRTGDLRGAVALEPELVEAAGEDVVQSTTVAASAVDFDSRGARVFGYEGPFGVGYCEAILHSQDA